MNPKNFIKTRLNEIRNIFPELSFKYKFNPNTSTHIVDVRPLDCFKENPDYIKYEADFGFEFNNLFYPETVLFVSEDSLTQISNPEFVFNANQFSEDLQVLILPLEVNSKWVQTHYEFEAEYALAA